MNYGIPTFKLNGNLVHFGAFKNHIRFYPTPSAIDAFEKDLSPYEISKGTVKFALDKPIPFELIKKIDGVVNIESIEDHLLIDCEHDLRSKISKAIAESESSLLQMKLQDYALEEIYLKYFQ